MFSTFYRIAKQDNPCWQKQQQYPGILYTQHTKVPWEKGHKHSRLIYQELLRNINSSYLGRVWAVRCKNISCWSANSSVLFFLFCLTALHPLQTRDSTYYVYIFSCSLQVSALAISSKLMCYAAYE